MNTYLSEAKQTKREPSKQNRRGNAKYNSIADRKSGEEQLAEGHEERWEGRTKKNESKDERKAWTDQHIGAECRVPT